MSQSSAPTPPVPTLTIRPGDVIEIPAGAEPGRRAASRLHVVSTSYREGDDCGFLRGYNINADGTRRRGQREPRSAWVRWSRLTVATVSVQIGADAQPAPLVVAPDEEQALPLLPVLTWERSQVVFGYAWPDTGVYLAAHVHRHEQCGHLSRCGFPDGEEPCQACECHDERCWDCQLAPAASPAGEASNGDAAGEAQRHLGDVVRRIHRRYPQAALAYVSHPEGDEGRVILWNLRNDDGLLWPDEHGHVFQGADDLGERLWLGDPFAELAEINRLLTEVFRLRGSALFESGELGGGWYLPLAS